jgi:two-component system response regulator NreC
VDVVVLDIGMPGLNGLEALRRIKGGFPDLAVLILTGHASEPYLFQVIQAGGAGCVLKQTADEHLLGAIRGAARGVPFLYPEMESRLLTVLVHRARRAGQDAHEFHTALTEREREVLSLVAQGYTNWEIASALVVSVKTVETHRTHVMNKLGLARLSELVHYALREGFLTGD